MISVFRLSDFQISGSAISSRKNNQGTKTINDIVTKPDKKILYLELPQQQKYMVIIKK